MPSPTAEDIHAEIAAGKVAAAHALPRLIAQREALEKEAGALAVAKQKRHVFLIVCGAAAAMFGLYSLWTTLAGSASVLGWVATVCLAVVAWLILQTIQRGEGERVRHLEGLSTKMLMLGRRIDSASRTLRR
jgi:hypothetical protein